MSAVYDWIHRVWYGNSKSGWILLPLSGVYWLAIRTRSFLYRCGVLRSFNVPAPVIIVGNITVGGTGKSPIVIWLVNELKARGFHPGIVSRGYGGSRSGTAVRVAPDSEASRVGDEPVMLARRTACPVVVDSDRFRGAAMLASSAVDVIVSDDGLQHHRLRRDFEICVIDGQRKLGNRRVLPAGPLRDSVKCLQSHDQILVNGGDFDNALRFDLKAEDAKRVNGSAARPLTSFRNTTVHAVAGIGNPRRFFDMLRGHGIQVIEHSRPDHAPLSVDALQFGDSLEVLMTEKDVVKLGRKSPNNYWFVPVDVSFDTEAAAALVDNIESRIRRGGQSS